MPQRIRSRLSNQKRRMLKSWTSTFPSRLRSGLTAGGGTTTVGKGRGKGKGKKTNFWLPPPDEGGGAGGGTGGHCEVSNAQSALQVNVPPATPRLTQVAPPSSSGGPRAPRPPLSPLPVP